MILSQTVAPEQMQKLLATGKTDLLDGFVSARTKRKFKAYLVKTPEGKIGFEFEQRAPKATTPKASSKASTKTASKSKTEAKPKSSSSKNPALNKTAGD